MKTVRKGLSVLLAVIMVCSMITISIPAGATVTSEGYKGISEPANLVPEDVFASKTETQKLFTGSVGGAYSVENGEYVYKIAGNAYTDAWLTKEHFPDGSFTVKMDIRPTEYTKDGENKYSGMGILLGYGNRPNGDHKWMNIRFDINYSTKKINFYVWEHCGSNAATPSYGTSWYEGTLPDDLWFEAVFEFTSTKTKIYLDGYQAPDFTDPHTSGTITASSLGHFPTTEELTYIGFFPSTDACSVKNFGIYEGVDLRFNSVPENLFYSNETASKYFHKVGTSAITSASTYTVEDGEYVMYLPHESAWTVSDKLPSGPFTIEFELKPTIKEGTTTPGSAGIMLGTSAAGVNNWIDVQLLFKAAGSSSGISYPADGVYAYEWLNPAGGSQTSKYHNTATILTGSEYVTTPQWYNIRIEVGYDCTRMYVDGALLPEALLNKLPTCDTVKMFGLWPAGGTGGYYVKNYKIFEGVSEGLVPEDVFANYDTAASWFTNVQKVNAYDQSSCFAVDKDGEYMMRVPVVSNGSAWIYDNRTIPYDSYTVSVDFSPNAYGDSKVGGAGFQVGETVSSGYRFHQLRFDFDKAAGTMSFRGHAQGNDPDHTYNPDTGIDYIDGFTVVKRNLDFSTKQWFNLTAEVTGNSIQVFLDGEPLFVEKIDRLPTAEDIAYFGFMAEGGTAGFDVKNFSITEGVEGEIKSATPELKDSIAIHFAADIQAEPNESVQMKFNFKGEAIWVDGEANGSSYNFTLPSVLPQDMGENISAELYINGVRKDKVGTYSMKAYCMNQLAQTTDTELRALLVALLNYGASAEQYFGKDVTELANGALTDEQKAYLSDFVVSEAAGVVTDPVTGTEDANYKWTSATLGLYDLIKVRFKFKVADVENTRIQIVGTETIFDKDDFQKAANGNYWVYTDGIYASDFDVSFKAIFIDAEGNQIGEAVEYSVNTYLHYVDSLTSSDAKPMVQAIYNYGMAAQAYATP